jgi:hypothetical protein
MTSAISANPGQTVTLAIQVVDSTGVLGDGYQDPTVDFVRLPNGSYATGLPIGMTEIRQGIWIHSLVIPTGWTAQGTYVVSCSWPDPGTSVMQNQLFIVHVALPFGNSSVSPA